uniref:Uncharacterized protein n=1 Tax=Opuntia streptacantha TaxID=393608 RepID=A0A7C9DHN4_OPUST
MDVIPHFLSSGIILKITNEIIMHAIQYSIACLTIFLAPCLVRNQPSLILLSGSNVFVIFVFSRRDRHRDLQRLQYLRAEANRPNLLEPRTMLLVLRRLLEFLQAFTSQTPLTRDGGYRLEREV